MMSKTVPERKYYYLLLVIIYIGYVSLGLPDTVLGVAWPVMRLDLHRGVEWAGILATMIILCSAVSGFSSGYFINRVPAGILLLVSGVMTGVSLLGFGLAPNFLTVLLLAVPLGLGGGCIDAAMNSFIARHYTSRHMSWLHGSWGIGATIGPSIMTAMIASGHGWRWGYGTIAVIQLTMALVFLATLRLWTVGTAAAPAPAVQVETPPDDHKPWHLWSDLSAWLSILTFFCYTGAEYGFGLWGATFLMTCRGATAEQAGYGIALYWGALTFGRFCSGVIADRVGNRHMVIGGILVALGGQSLLFFGHSHVLLLPSLALMGFGLAPIYPCMMHETARRFLEKRANIIIGFQSGSACLGVAMLPTITGWVLGGGVIGFTPLPMILSGILLTLLALFVLLNRRT